MAKALEEGIANLGYETTCYVDPALYEDFYPLWQAVKDKPKYHPERVRLAQQLVRYAFTDYRDLLNNDTYPDERSGTFCHGKDLLDGAAKTEGFLVRTDSCKHCRSCKACVDEASWHCGQCDGHYDLLYECDLCGGVSEAYHPHHLDERLLRRREQSERLRLGRRVTELASSPPSL
jgi:hypothetical protein